jgi:hypothetical protein
MSQRQRRKRQKQLRHDHHMGFGRKRVAVGTGLSVGAALGATATAQATDYMVANTNPSGSGSLAQAMTDQNNGTGPDRVLFQSGLSGSITLTSDLTAVDEPLQILGPGANVLAINGNNAHRIFNVISPGNLTVSGLTMTNGNPSVGAGGAIQNNGGTVTVQDSNISGNTGYGAGIYSGYGTLTVQRSTVSGNNNYYGIRTRGDDTTIQDSTISGNHSYGLRISHASAHIQNSTISGNTAAGLVGFYGYFDMTSTVVSDSGAGSDLFNSSGSSFAADFSLIENTGGNPITGANNITGADPALGALGSNGGPTPTKRPSNTSLLLDKGSGAGTDQRGEPRPFDIASIPNTGNGADIGAVELQASDFPARAAPAPATPTTSKKKKCKKKKKHKRSAESAKKKHCKKKKK